MSIKFTRYAVALLCCLSPLAVLAQYTPPTPPPESKQFEFLLGEWDVQGYFTAKNGQQVPFGAALTAQTTHDDWALQADMRISFGGKQIFHGTYYHAYNPKQAQWVCKYFWSVGNEWIDYSGRFADGKMVFTSEPDSEGKITRMTYFDITEQKFSFTADISDDGGQTWRDKDTAYTCTRLAE